MSERSRSAFTTGAFARLCGTTKETLFHYDAIGLLKPKEVRPNGYRAYAPEQFFDFDMVRMLRRAGSSLKEIKGYLEHYDPPHFLAMLREKEMALTRQIEQLEEMRRVLRHHITTTEYALTQPYLKPWVEYQVEEQLVTTPIDAQVQDDEALAQVLMEHFQYCEAHGVVDHFPLGTIVEKEHIYTTGYDADDHFFSLLPPGAHCGRERVKPAGLYAVQLHQGYLEEFLPAYQGLLDYIGEKGLAPVGDVYFTELVSYVASGDASRFVMRIAIQVG